MNLKLMQKALSRIAEYRNILDISASREAETYCLGNTFGRTFAELHQPKKPGRLTPKNFENIYLEVDFSKETITATGCFYDGRGRSFADESTNIPWTEIQRLEPPILSCLVSIEEHIDKEDAERRKKVEEENRKGQLQNRALLSLWKEM